jgi:hypothetical protein
MGNFKMWQAKKWAKVGHINNQTFILGPTHERGCVRMISKKTSIKSKFFFAHVGDPPKKLTTKDKIKPISFQRGGLESEQLRVKRFWHLITLSGMGKCQFQHVLLHPKE